MNILGNLLPLQPVVEVATKEAAGEVWKQNCISKEIKF